MLILSQKGDKITESLEFNIEEIETCKNNFIDEKSYKDFKKIIQKNNNFMCLKELKGLTNFLNQIITKTTYCIIEIKTNRVFRNI